MRLIDADALIDEHYEACNKDKRKKFPSWSLRLMWEAPTIDAVPVVRCKDCKWFGKMGCAIEVVDETDIPKENDFCSFAERKDDE